MSYLNVKNNVQSKLASSILSTDLSLTVTTGDGTLFPTTNFHITIGNEIILCTSRATDVFTIVRAQEGTTATAHTVNDAVELRITAQIISELQTQTVSKIGDTMTGDLIGTDFVSTRSGTITRVGGYLSKVVKTGGRTLNITRNTSNKISSITDGIRTWNFTRTSGVITSWNVV